jgi:hypothetical protein
MSTETHWWPRGDIKGGEEVTVWLVDDVLNLGIRKVLGHRCHGSPNLVNFGMETYSPQRRQTARITPKSRSTQKSNSRSRAVGKDGVLNGEVRRTENAYR